MGLSTLNDVISNFQTHYKVLNFLPQLQCVLSAISWTLQVWYTEISFMTKDVNCFIQYFINCVLFQMYSNLGSYYSIFITCLSVYMLFLVTHYSKKNIVSSKTIS